jgi:hypothetical protein
MLFLKKEMEPLLGDHDREERSQEPEFFLKKRRKIRKNGRNSTLVSGLIQHGSHFPPSFTPFFVRMGDFPRQFSSATIMMERSSLSG